MIDVTYWERRDNADREAVGRSAFELTQAMKASGSASSRFYWASPDTIVVQTDVGEMFSENPPSAAAAQALFALGDLARQARHEQWIDAGVGERSYRSAGR